ncbi:MAG: C4-type zinc ribbon domain-containing protein [Acidobacteriota bacterium]
MHPDLDRLIRLQRLEDLAGHARRVIADEPTRQQDLDARLAAAQKRLDDERLHLDTNRAARRELDKAIAAQQGRLSKFRDQLMEVKTNREYHAVQKEIEVAQSELQKLEDQLLERMIESDEVNAALKDAEHAFADEMAAIAAERDELARQAAESKHSIGAVTREREAMVKDLNPALLATFERILKLRKVSAVAEVRDGRCSVCQVRIRPQVANDLRHNDMIFQCESCQRILYYPVAAPAQS